MAALPEKCRTPLLLCYWEGRTNEEVARRLGWPCGTVKTRLAKARRLLHVRLVRRGVTLPAGVLTRLLAPGGEAAVPPALVSTTAGVVALAGGGVKGMSLARAKLGLLFLLTAGVAAGAGALAHQLPAAKQPEAAPRVDAPKPAEEARARTDRYGDPLPEGALARVGTVRLRHGDSIASVAFAPGKTLASASYDKTIRLWDVDTGAEVRCLTGHTAAVHAVRFSSDGATLVSAGGDKSIRLWDVASGKQRRTFEGHQDTVFALAVSPRGETPASGSRDQTVRLWDLKTGPGLGPDRPPHGRGTPGPGTARDGRPLGRPRRQRRRPRLPRRLGARRGS